MIKRSRLPKLRRERGLLRYVSRSLSWLLQVAETVVMTDENLAFCHPQLKIFASDDALAHEWGDRSL